MDSQFWIGLTQIIWIDLLLSGDNAVVIALACRRLPPTQRRWGIILGSGAAIALRVIFAAFILYLLGVPYLKLIGAIPLLWIAVKLVLPEEVEEHENIESADNLWAAVRTIVIADAVMSLDNVIGIAAAAKGDVVLIVLGLLISIPLIIGSLILRLLDKYPQIAFIWRVAGLYRGRNFDYRSRAGALSRRCWRLAELGCAVAGAAFVILLGPMLRPKKARPSEVSS